MKNQNCPKLKNRSAKEIASFLIRKFNEEKVKDVVEEFGKLGFTAESLVISMNNLFKFLVLIGYDRRPFSPYEIVWNKNDPNSVFSILERHGLLNLDKVMALSEDDLDRCLEKYKVKGLVLSYVDLGKRIKSAKMIKDIASKIREISACLKSLRSGQDVIKLHRLIDDIYGIGPTIASKFIMYVIRCMKIGRIDPSELAVLAKNLKNEWRNSKWVRRLKKYGILEEVEKELRKDPFAFDYFWDLDRDYCSKGKCNECEL